MSLEEEIVRAVSYEEKYNQKFENPFDNVEQTEQTPAVVFEEEELKKTLVREPKKDYSMNERVNLKFDPENYVHSQKKIQQPQNLQQQVQQNYVPPPPPPPALQQSQYISEEKSEDGLLKKMFVSLKESYNGATGLGKVMMIAGAIATSFVGYKYVAQPACNAIMAEDKDFQGTLLSYNLRRNFKLEMSKKNFKANLRNKNIDYHRRGSDYVVYVDKDECKYMNRSLFKFVSNGDEHFENLDDKLSFGNPHLCKLHFVFNNKDELRTIKFITRYGGDFNRSKFENYMKEDFMKPFNEADDCKSFIDNYDYINVGCKKDNNRLHVQIKRRRNQYDMITKIRRID